jgi:hypothetical protein
MRDRLDRLHARAEIHDLLMRYRVIVHDWSVSTRLDPTSSFPLAMDGLTQGRRDRSDPVCLR